VKKNKDILIFPKEKF